MHWYPAASPSLIYSVNRAFSVRRRYPAHFFILRPDVTAHFAYLLFLRCVGSNLPLATEHPLVAVPPVPGQKAKRVTEPNRFVRL
jgi:hypothetical protein